MHSCDVLVPGLMADDTCRVTGSEHLHRRREERVLGGGGVGQRRLPRDPLEGLEG